MEKITYHDLHALDDLKFQIHVLRLARREGVKI
jgi:hypothetical protein